MIAEALAVAAERLGDHEARVLARLGGPLGHAAREAAGALAALDAAPRKRRRTEIAVLARAPVPAGLRAVHVTWLEQALGELPARARTAVAAASTDPIDVWLARWATAGLPPAMPADGRDAAALVEWIASIGADQVAFALGEQARGVPALAAAAERITKPPRAGQLGPQRAALARCRDVSLDDDLAFVRVGSRALAPHLAADQLACMQLTRRMPRSIATVVLHEVRAHAATSFEQSPTWSALQAR